MMARRHGIIIALRGHFLLLASLVAFTFVSWGLSRQLIKKYTVDQELLRMQRVAEGIEHENETLRTLIEYTKTTQFIEREARLKKGLKAPGEEVAIIRGIKKNEESQRAIPDDERTNPERWRDYILFGANN